jgi:ATP-dependent Clp protease adaptor protein ClpS
MTKMNPDCDIAPRRSDRHATKLESEPPYRVFVHNDDVTPMDFVVHILVTIFLVPSLNAEHIMYTAHITGRAYVQTLPAREARLRINRAHFAAGLRNVPLQFSMEAE